MTTIYGTRAGYSSYHTARNHSLASHTDARVDAALIVASEWIDAVYRMSFPGLKVGMRSQEREWPREGGMDIYGYAISSASVPTEIINATYEAAYRQIETPGCLSIDWTPSKYKRVSVDGAVSAEYQTFDSIGDAQMRLAIVDQILDPILTGTGADISKHSGSVLRG